MTRSAALVALVALASFAGPGAAAASTENAAERPAALASVDYEQRLGNSLPLGARFRDESGAAVSLGDYFGRRPVLVVPAYYRCPMLCTLVLDGVARALRVSAVDLEVVVFSIDPAETSIEAAAKKAKLLAPADKPERWHLLTGDEPAIRSLAGAIGFHYAWDEANARWAHPAGIVVATPDGHVARYLFGVDYAPRDLRLALVEASAGRVGSVVDRLLLFCYAYDPAAGAYSLAVLRGMRVAGALTLVALGVFVTVAVRRERRLGRVASSGGSE
jgi:protein SCO1/2